MELDRSRQDLFESLVGELRQHLQKNGLRRTQKREDVLWILVSAGGHLSVDEIALKLSKAGARVGASTIYRAVRLLTDIDLLSARDFGDGHTRYEVREEEHHDHLICVECGRIVEFEDTILEERQIQVAETLGFRLVNHRMELFGVCGDRENLSLIHI